MMLAAVELDFAPFAWRVPSVLSDHGTDCCRVARQWFLAMDRSMWKERPHVGSPLWVSVRYAWGPTRWPAFWCQVVAAEELDCGANSALCLEAFRARGAEVLPVQLVERFDPDAARHWRARWNACGAVHSWAGDVVAYHEACAVVRDGTAEIWDPTASTWVSPEHHQGYSSIAGVRIGGVVPTGETLAWGNFRLPVGEWLAVGAEAGPG